MDAEKPGKKKKKSKRKRGGQPNHPPHLKELLPIEQVTEFEHFIPDECANCHAELPRDAGPNDPEPKRFQTIELPPIVLDVKEYQAHTRTCPCCSHVNQATISSEIQMQALIINAKRAYLDKRECANAFFCRTLKLSRRGR